MFANHPLKPIRSQMSFRQQLQC